MTTTFRTKAFKRAYEIEAQTGLKFPACLKKAWEIHRLLKQMQAGNVTFSYEKTDGSLRKAKGTLKDLQSQTKDTGAENYKTVCYYDMDANGFRSFRVENFRLMYEATIIYNPIPKGLA